MTDIASYVTCFEGAPAGPLARRLAQCILTEDLEVMHRERLQISHDERGAGWVGSALLGSDCGAGEVLTRGVVDPTGNGFHVVRG